MDDNSDPVAPTLTLGQRVADALSILVKGQINGISQEDAATVMAHVDAIKVAEDSSIASMQEAVTGLSSFEDTLTPDVETLKTTVADLATRVSTIEAELDTLPGALDGLVATAVAANTGAPADPSPASDAAADPAPADPAADPVVAADPAPAPVIDTTADAPTADTTADPVVQPAADAPAAFGQSVAADPSTGT